MSYEFVIKKRPKDSEAIIYSGKQEIAKIKKHEGFSFKLIRYKDKEEWVLSNIVDGQRRPFSYTVRKAIKKAKRCLATNGYLLIAETSKSMKGRLSKIKEIIEQQGFDIYNEEEKGDFTFIEAREL